MGDGAGGGVERAGEVVRAEGGGGFFLLFDGVDLGGVFGLRGLGAPTAGEVADSEREDGESDDEAFPRSEFRLQAVIALRKILTERRPPEGGTPNWG